MRYEISIIKKASHRAYKWMRLHSSHKKINSIGTIILPDTMCSIIEYYMTDDSCHKSPCEIDPTVNDWLSSICQDEVDDIFESFNYLLDDQDSDFLTSEDLLQLCKSIIYG